MFSALPMYQRQGKTAFKKDLSNTLKFCAHLGNPQDQFKSIHVAGTNGKGSCSHMLSAMLQQAGYKVGLYTSPHLKDFRERIRISGKMIGEEDVIDFIDKNSAVIEDVCPSFFEMTVAMAFDHFAKERVDIAVIEVGLGGRLDSTNVIQPEISLITNIGFDHMEMLGDTLAQIAAEKAGIIKEGIPVVIGEYQNETAPVFESIAKERNAPLCYAEQVISSHQGDFETDLKGTYQQKNLKSALATLTVLNQQADWNIDLDRAKKGLLHVTELTGLKGRWQRLSQKPLTLCDTGHNQEALDYILPALTQLDKDELWMVLGFVKEKQVEQLLRRLPATAKLVFTEADIPRAMPLNELKSLVAQLNMEAVFIEDVNKALKFARSKASEKDVIFVGGSTFVVAEIEEL